MGQFGFTTYIQPKPVAPPTLQERLALLSSDQKIAILNGYAEQIIPNRLKSDIAVEKDLIIELYRKIEGIEDLAALLMREEVVIVEGTETTPPEYNTAPTTINDLKDEVYLNFTDVFSLAQVGAVIDKIIEYAEKDIDGNPIGTATVYADEVVK